MFDAAIEVLRWAASSVYPDLLTQPQWCDECGSSICEADIPGYLSAIRVLEAAAKIGPLDTIASTTGSGVGAVYVQLTPELNAILAAIPDEGHK